MKKLFKRWNECSLVLRILGGLILGIALGLALPQATPIALLGDLFVGALRSIAPILVLFLVMTSLARHREGQKTNMSRVILLYLLGTFLDGCVAVVTSFLFPVTLELTVAEEGLASPGGIGEVLYSLLMKLVSNPVDVLTYAAWRMSGLPAGRVIGSGTVLDTARLKHLLGQHLQVDSRNVHAVIIGEHGDSELAVWSGANVSGIDLNHFCELRGHYNHADSMRRIYEGVRDSAYQIIARKGATYYGIAMAVGRIAECIVLDQESVLPVSVVLEGQYGLDGLCLSIPSIVGKNGLEKILEIPLSLEEEAALHTSAAQLKSVIAQLEL